MTDEAPGAKPPEKTKSNLLFLALGCGGCGFLLLLLGVGGTMAWLLFQQSRVSRTLRLPAGWRDSIRVAYRLPGVAARLAVPATGDGDAAAWLTFSRASSESTSYTDRLRVVRRLARGDTLTAAERAVVTASLSDPAADSAATAARQRRYEVLARLADPPSGPRLMPPMGEGVVIGGMGISRAGDRLILRGQARLWRRDLAGARADFGAVVALGRLAWTHEVGPLALTQGRRLMQSGAEGYQRLARVSKDSALRRDAGELLAWATDGSGWFYRVTAALPDSVILAARDTSLPRGLRTAALESICLTSFYQPLWRLVTGPRRDVMAAVRDLSRDADPVVARAAVIADSTLSRMHAVGMRGRYRIVTGRTPH